MSIKTFLTVCATTGFLAAGGAVLIGVPLLAGALMALSAVCGICAVETE